MTLALVAALHFTTTPVAGRLLEADGRPAAKATLYGISGSVNDPRTFIVTTTDAEGRFRMTSPLPNGVVGSSQSLLVKTKKGLLFPVRLSIFTNAETTVTLPPAVKFRCQIVGRDNRPIPGMAVSLESLSTPSTRLTLPLILRDLTRGITDSKGYLHLTFLPRDGEFVLFSTDSRYALRTPRIQYADGPTSVGQALYAERAGAISGRIEPAHVKTSLVAIHNVWKRRYYATSDAKGHYRISGLLPGTYRVEVLSVAEQRKLGAPAVARVAVPIGESATGIDFRLRPSVSIQGQVTGVPSGKPLPQLSVRIWRPGSVDPFEVFTNVNGRYSIPGLPGPHRISIGYALEKKVEVGSKGSREDYSIRDPETYPAFVPPPPRLLTVLSEDGKPVAGAEVVQSNDFGRPNVFVTDAQGRIEYPGHMRPPIILRARKGDQATEKAVSLLDEKKATLRLKSRALGRIGGQVVDREGKALAGAVVTIFEQTGSMGASIGNVLSDAQGRWHFDQAWPDARYSALASVPGYRNALAQEQVVPKAGEETNVEIPALTRLTGVAEGRVVDGKGKPIAGVMVGTDQGTEAWSVTDRHGKFRLEALEERTSVVARETFEREVRKSVKAGDRGVELVLPDSKVESAPRPDAAEMLVGKAAPEIEPTVWIDGQSRSLASLKGKVVVIDFWGISCGPCVGALPAVQQLWETFKKRDVVLIGLHDSSGTKEEVAKFAKERGLTYPIAIDAEKAGSFGASFAKYGITGIPRIVILDREGEVAHVDWTVHEAVRHVTDLVLGKPK